MRPLFSLTLLALALGSPLAAAAEAPMNPYDPVTRNPCDWVVGDFSDRAGQPLNAPVLIELQAVNTSTDEACPFDLASLSVSVAGPEALPGSLRRSGDPDRLVWVPERAFQPLQTYTLTLIAPPFDSYDSEQTLHLQFHTGSELLPTDVSLSLDTFGVGEERVATKACCPTAYCYEPSCVFCWDDSYTYPVTAQASWTFTAPAFAELYEKRLSVLFEGAELGRRSFYGATAGSIELASVSLPVCLRLSIHDLMGEELTFAQRCTTQDAVATLEHSGPELVDFTHCDAPWNYNDHPLRGNETASKPDSDCSLGLHGRADLPYALFALALFGMLALALVATPRRKAPSTSCGGR